MKPLPSHELVGARVVGDLPSADMVDLWARISSGIVKYGFVIEYYEFQAAGFGMQLMHERGVTRLDQWYSDFVETDWRYVERFYQTDKIPPWADCIVAGCRLIEPAPIPALRHRQVEVRFAF